jgi:hypothetical protein
MILLDYSQICISNLMQQVASSVTFEENLIRHMVLNSIRMYKVKFGNKYGDLVICCDSRHYWRKEQFPYYKSNRKKTRNDSPLDWDAIFTSLNKIKEEIKENFPYKVLTVETAEADDIIGTGAIRYNQSEPILIISGDKDFAQLQRFPNVHQYAPIQKKFVQEPDPCRFLQEHILRGDAGDGIPNILSSDDCFINSRQTPLRQTKIDEWLGSGVPLEELFRTNQKLLANYQRNRMLVDLTQIPLNIKEKIIEEFDAPFTGTRKNLFGYFIKHNLKNLQEHITEF